MSKSWKECLNLTWHWLDESYLPAEGAYAVIRSIDSNYANPEREHRNLE